MINETIAERKVISLSSVVGTAVPLLPYMGIESHIESEIPEVNHEK